MIDLHTHLHPPRLFAAIRRWFAERTDWDLASQPMEPCDVAAVLRANGVEQFVFCSYAHKPGMAAEINAWLTQTARALEGYGVPLATVHPSDAAPLEDLRAALDDGCIGLKLHEDVQQLAVDDPRLMPIFAEMAKRGAFLLVHVGPIPWSYPPNVGRERVERVLRAHPELNVVVAHMGAPDTRAYFDLMRAHPRLHLDTTMVFAPDAAVAGAAGIDLTSLATHADRVVYGTDFPVMPHAYDSELRRIESFALPAPALHAIVHENAARLLAQAGVAPGEDS